MRSALFLTVLMLCGVLAFSAYALRLTFVSDLISTSAPDTGATHTIQFTLAQDVPASGHIVITFEPDVFTIPPTFDYTDVDFAVWNGGAYVDRDIADIGDTATDSVSVTTGTSGSVDITLNPAAGLTAGDQVQIRLGTNAIYGAEGVDNIVNPDAVDSYIITITTRDGSNALIDTQNAMIAIVEPVGMTMHPIVIAPVRSNGLPSGLLAANNHIIELSLNTNVFANCRYATTTDVLYDNMTGQFNPVSGTTHYVNTTPYANDTTYNYYVRCKATNGGAKNDDDYLISFTLKPNPISNTSIETEGFVTNGPQGNLGNGGHGDFNNGSAVLYLSSVTFSGRSVPGSRITLLQDGALAGTAQAKDDGTFSTSLSGLERGVYSFQLYAQDNLGLTSSLYSTTLTLTQGTENDVTNIIIPPTIKISSDTVQAGDTLIISGSAPPNEQVKVYVVGQGAAADIGNAQILSATSSASGLWSASPDTHSFTKGTYGVQAIVMRADQSKSSPSKMLTFVVGTGGSTSSCAKPDMNGDTKVNLIDFSIFLLSWGTEEKAADFSCDGSVNLGDFSIMLFNWTG